MSYKKIKECDNMAIWQVCFFIIPRKNSKCNLNCEEVLSWGKQNKSIEKINFLKKEKSWTTDEVSQYGRDDETCIEFFYEGGILHEVSCRLDLRSLTKRLLGEILEYVNSIQGMILFEDKLYEPNMNQVVEILRNSNSNRFCKSPVDYFNSLSSS